MRAGPGVPAITITLITTADGLLQSSQQMVPGCRQTLTLQTAGTPRQLGTGEKQDNWSLVLSMQVLSSILNPHGTCVSISCVHWNIVLIKLLHASYNPAYNKQNDWYLTLHWHVTLYVESHWWLIGHQTTVCVPRPHNPVRCLVSSVLFLASDPCSTVIRPTPADPPHPGRGAMCNVTSR